MTRQTDRESDRCDDTVSIDRHDTYGQTQHRPDGQTQHRYRPRRSVLGSAVAAATIGLAGCLTAAQDDREIHKPVREWQEDRNFTVDVEAGEIIVIEVDTRRWTPTRTVVNLFDPKERPIEEYELLKGEFTPIRHHEAEMDGTYTLYVTPDHRDTRARVWIRIWVSDTVPEVDTETRIRGLVSAIEETPEETVHDWELGDDRASVSIETDGSVINAIMVVSGLYSDAVDSGLDVSLDGEITDGEETITFEIDLEWARDAADEELSREAYLDRIFETVE